MQSAPPNRPHRSLLVVGCFQAVREREIAAAASGRGGLRVATVSGLAARLAGGFLRPATAVAIRTAVLDGTPEVFDIGELEPISKLPGFADAAARSLRRYWTSSATGHDLASTIRGRDFLELEEGVVRRLPDGMVPHRDLAALAMARIGHAAAAIGPIEVEPGVRVEAVFRPLMRALHAAGLLEWLGEAPSWMPVGTKAAAARRCDPVVNLVSCASPRHEVTEAIRWARSQIASGTAPGKLTIAAVEVESAAVDFAAVAALTSVPVHFSEGIPLLSTAQGSRCAALADILLRGLNRKRVMRLAEVCAGQGGALADMPEGWSAAMSREAALSQPHRWARALDRDEAGRSGYAILKPLLAMFERGTADAAELGELLLTGAALTAWRRALSDGPSVALDATLAAARVADDSDPHSSVVFCSFATAAHLCRERVRLIGATATSWPRRTPEDPLLPSHVIDGRILFADREGELQNSDWRSLLRRTNRSVQVSWSRRSADGRPSSPSPALPAAPIVTLALGRRPETPLTESDRLFSRGVEFASTERARSVLECHRSRLAPAVGAWDGLVARNHPALARARNMTHSAKSLRSMLRDPAAFVWRYVAGFVPTEASDEPPFLDARRFGTLVHDILQSAVSTIEMGVGLARAERTLIERVVSGATIEAGRKLEAEAPVPPLLVWRVALDRAERMAVAALTHDGLAPLPDQRSYAEIGFGLRAHVDRAAPWRTDEVVRIPVSNLRINGYVDRIDVSETARRARVIDYKTSRKAGDERGVSIDGGRELQRVLYGFAVKALLGRDYAVEASLLHPSRANAHAPLEDTDATLAAVADAVDTMLRRIEDGMCLPGPDAYLRWNDHAFMMPADARTSYESLKSAGFTELFGDAADVWSLA